MDLLTFYTIVYMVESPENIFARRESGQEERVRMVVSNSTPPTLSWIQSLILVCKSDIVNPDVMI